jgi:hypothetical protein
MAAAQALAAQMRETGMKNALLSRFQKKPDVKSVSGPVRKRTPIRMPAPGQPLPLPKIIERRLHAISARALHVSWTEGALWLIAGAAGLLLLQTGSDWLFDLSWRMRFALLMADTLLAGWLVWRFGINPWHRRLSLEEAALRAEARWPDWSTSLISAVQLARNPEGARPLVEALIRKVAKRAESMSLRAAIDASHLKRLKLAAAVLFFAVGVAGWWFMPKSLILLKRLALSNIPLPTQTIVIPISGDLAIPPGDTIELSAKAEGVLPRTGRVEITYAGKTMQSIPVAAKPATPSIYSLEIPNVQQPLTYRFYLNDGRSPEFNVTLLYGPVMESVAFEQIPPGYTGLPRVQLAAGNLSLLAGSKLHIEGRASQPLKSAQVKLRGAGQPVEMKIGPDGKSVSAEFSIPAKDLEGFSILLENSENMVSQDNTFYHVEVIPDKPPEVIFAANQRETATFVATARPRLQFEVHDDFQVKQVLLCCELQDNEAGEGTSDASKIKKIPLEVAQSAGSLVFNYEWKNPEASVEWKEGNTFNYWIEAVDNNDVTGPGVGKSPVHKWQVVSLETKKQELEEKLRKHAESIEDLSHTQQEIRDSVGSLIKKEDAPASRN